MRQYNKHLPYRRPNQHKDDNIDTFFYSVESHDGTTAVEIIVGTKTLLMYVYAIGYKSDLNRAKVLQDRFCERGIIINIWYNNAQEEFMKSARKLLHTYGVGSKQYKAHTQNHNPAECRIREIKSTTFTILDIYGASRWSWLLCMEYVVSITNCMAHRYLSWRTPHEDTYGFTTNIAHLMEFELWEPILILD